MAEFAARFYDGRTAARREVTARLDAERLEIVVDGEVLEKWPGDGLLVVDSGGEDDAVCLTHAANDSARLIVADAGFRAELLRRFPDMAHLTRSGPVTLRRAATWGAGFAVAAVIAVATVQYLPGLGAALIPLRWEERAGRQTVDQVLALFTMGKTGSGVCTRPAGRAALDRLTARLGAGIDSPYRFRVTVADISMANAFAAPGGHVVVFRGLFKAAESADAIAGILAHEFAHVIHRHPTEGVVRAAGLSMVLDLLTGNIAGGDVIAGAGKFVIGATYSRGAEAEADATAVEILTAAGISTAGLEAFFRKLAKQEKVEYGNARLAKVLEVISSHPRSAARAAAVAHRQGAATRPALNRTDWQALKNICSED